MQLLRQVRDDRVQLMQLLRQVRDDRARRACELREMTTASTVKPFVVLGQFYCIEVAS